jgi:two-component system, chemotaxis family, sensor kinase CheA
MSPTNPKDIFKQEAHDLLAQLETTLLDLDADPSDASLIDAAFRALHTIKGSGAMFGFEGAAAFTHHVETAFDQVRQGKAALSKELIGAALEARDHIRLLIENPEDADSAAQEALLAALQASFNPGQASAAPLAKEEPVAEREWRIRIRLPRDAMINGTNPLLLLEELRTLGQARVDALTDDIPGLQEIDPTACYMAWDVDLKTARPCSEIEDVFIFVRDEMQLDIAPAESVEHEQDHQAVEPEPVLREEPPAAEEEAASPVAEAPPPKVEEAPAKAEAPPAKTETMPAKTEAPLASAKPAAAPDRERARRDATKASASVRVPAERLDELMDRVGELVIAQSRLRQIAAGSADQQVRSVAEEIERLALELRDTTMGIRMVPIGSLFGRFRRVVHDLSRDLGKEVELLMEGEDTELDKTVIEQLNDPLVHLIRNAIDHGVEAPADRRAAGKTVAGRILLSARHAGTEVHITIADDGRGLDRERIRARAIERGVIPPDAALSDGELFQVIFQPGFSTAEEVTSLSGRGVGMDVVKRTIEALRGKIELSSAPNQGSKVTLRLPLTLAIIDGLLVRVGDARYVLPLSSVEECVELPPEEETRSRRCSLLNIRGELVPYLKLRELFSSAAPPDRFQKIVVVSSGELKTGLVVDQVIGNHQTVIKSLSKLHADIEMFSGATILGDGSLALILDIAHLVQFGQVAEENLRTAA